MAGILIDPRERRGHSCTMVARRAFVSGRVQGVFYRATAVRKATSLALAGYARNLADGRVEVLAIGHEAPVAAFIEWLWEGSAASKVSGVECSDVDMASVANVAGFTSG
jgi:acylphosphatase